MGVNTQTYLPHDVQVRDVAEVIGLLAGLKSTQMKSISDTYRTVPGVKIEVCNKVPEMCTIIIRAPKGKTLVDGESVHHVHFHFEIGYKYSGKYGRYLSPRATPFWIAMMIRVAKFFGGRVFYRDCEGKTAAYGVYANRYFTKPRKHNDPEDDVEYSRFQKEIYSVKPITQADINRANRVAAYKNQSFD